MTETPFPFPAGPSSTPGLEGLIRVPIENLPDYSTGNTAGDLALLENVLASHGFHPIYVDLTRKDIDLPVVRAIVPSMEVVADFEWYSRAPPRLFYNYLKRHFPIGNCRKTEKGQSFVLDGLVFNLFFQPVDP